MTSMMEGGFRQAEVEARLIHVLTRMALCVLEAPDLAARAIESGPQNVQPQGGQQLTGKYRRRHGKGKVISRGESEMA